MAQLGGPPKPPGKPPPVASRPELRPRRPVRTRAPIEPSEPEPISSPDALERTPHVDRPPQREERRLPPKEEPRSLRDRVGDETVDANALGEMTVLLAAEHLMILLGKRRQKTSRAALLAEVGDLLLGHPRPDLVKKILMAMADIGRPIDIYPLEVMAYVLERDPRLVWDARFGAVIKNKRELEGSVFAVEEAIRLEIPLSAKVRAMALEGGGSPGYHLYPGALAEYFVELGDEGRWTILLRAEIHKEMILDRVVLEVRDTPGAD
jgi:hypothetical protein